MFRCGQRCAVKYLRVKKADCRTVVHVMQVYAEPIGYWRVGWNLFDFVILSMTILLAILEPAMSYSNPYLRVIRTMRIVCMFRILNHIHGLQILILAFFKTITEWVAPALTLLLIIIYIFAIISDHYFHTEELWWGTIGRCVLSLIGYITVRNNVDSVEFCSLKNAFITVLSEGSWLHKPIHF